MRDHEQTTADRLNKVLAEHGFDTLETIVAECFASYLTLLRHWNARMNLSAIRDEDGILRRHFVESIACARALSSEIKTLLDYGAGAGFPGIPIALCRPEIAVTLAESQNKKAAFLSEAIRVLGIDAKVHSGRAETLDTVFDCVTLRAVDKMEAAVQAAVQLVRPGGWLVLMTTGKELAVLKAGAGEEFAWLDDVPLPGGQDRILAMGTR